MLIMKSLINVLISNIFMGTVLWLSVESSKEENADTYQHCLDHKGKEVSHGIRFFPLGSDPCTQCTCLDGKPQMCIAVFCSPPENCKQYHALSDKCCEFVCLDRDFPNKASGNGTYPDNDTLSTTNLGLRLVASTVTSFLILALLLFMIHRLRQRRLLLMIRRFHARGMDNGNAHLSRRFSEDDDGSVGYFVGHDQLDFSRYDEPPPPYTLWKPPEMYIPPGEAPPPYDLSVQLTAPYVNSFSYAPADQVEIAHQAVISVHRAENPEPSHEAVATEASSAGQTETLPGPNCSICTAVDIELNNMANSTGGAVLPPDIQYEESGSYMANNAASSSQAETAPTHSEMGESRAVVAVAIASLASTSSSGIDNAVPSTSACTCNLVTKKGKSKRNSCCDLVEDTRSRPSTSRNNQDSCCSGYGATGQENNNLYPDPTVWCGEASESSSSSTPTYDQPTLSPSTSDSSSADADFPRAGGVSIEPRPGTTATFRTMPARSVGCRNLAAATFERSHGRDLPEDNSKAPHFQKTLSNLKKFSLIKRKKKKRRIERPSEISCSFVCQSITDNMPPTHQSVFEDGIDLTARNSTESISRPLEAINPHIGHKLASSGYKPGTSRPTSITLPRQYRHGSRRRELSGPSFISYADVHCCGSVVTVSGGTIDANCIACYNGSSPESLCDERGASRDSHAVQSSRSLNRQGISRSGSICSETGERRHHRSAGSSPASSRCNYSMEGNTRFTDARYASSSHIIINDRTMGVRNSFTGREPEDSSGRPIPVWVVNSLSLSSGRDYNPPDIHAASNVRRSASGSLGEGSRSVGDITSPLDYRDSMMSSGSSWEACSHL